MAYGGFISPLYFFSFFFNVFLLPAKKSCLRVSGGEIAGG